MNSILFKALPCLLATSPLFLFNCGITDSPRDAGLYYLGENPLRLSAGDTSSSLEFEKVVIADARGKKETLENYTKVKLESSDSTRVTFHGLRIIGVKSTTDPVTVTATETVDNEYKASFKVEVKK